MMLLAILVDEEGLATLDDDGDQLPSVEQLLADFEMDFTDAEREHIQFRCVTGEQAAVLFASLPAAVPESGPGDAVPE